MRLCNFFGDSDDGLLLQLTGARIDGAMNVRNFDLEVLPDNTMLVHLLEKGGLKRKVRIYNKEDVDVLMRLKSGCKRPFSGIFVLGNQRTGCINSNREAEKTTQAVVRVAARKTAIASAGQHFVVHSARKAFAQSRAMEYTHLSTTELLEEIEFRCINDQDLYRKFERIVLPKKRMPSVVSFRTKLIRFLTSLDIGHACLDVMKYYLDIPALRAALEEQVMSADKDFLEYRAHLEQQVNLIA